MTNSSSVEDLGSYPFGELPENDGEMRRLERQGEIGLALERSVLERLGLKPSMRALDLGSGPGVIACEMAKIVGQDGEVTGIDMSDGLLEIARSRKAGHKIRNVQFVKGSAYDLPVPDASFDFVYSRFLFQHLSAPAVAAKQIARVLRPGGIACLVDIDDAWLTVHPTGDALETFWAEARAAQAQRGGDRNVGRKLQGLLDTAGLAAVRTTIVPITSHDLGLATLFEMISGFKRELIKSSGGRDFSAALADAYASLKNSGGWAAVGLFCATGTKLK